MINIYEGSSRILTANVFPDNATEQGVTWRSDNTSVASVDANGRLTAHSKGSATITVTTVDGNKTATCTVNVAKAGIPVSSISLNKTSLSLTPAPTYILSDLSEFTLIATVLPADAGNRDVTWSSSNSSVAKVDAATGKVTAVAGGTATITATTVEGNKEASCEVMVKTKLTGGEILLDGVATPTSKTIKVGDVLVISRNILPRTPASGSEYEWYSTNWGIGSNSILSFDYGTKKITGKAKGTTTLTLQFSMMSHLNKTINIIVEDDDTSGGNPPDIGDGGEIL